jgi:pimeloyl-ACP methyl ester carboxylesterase
MGDVTIHYQVAGRGQPLVLIHGLSGSTRWWARNVGPLASRFQVHVVDLVGFGGSRAPSRFVLHDAAQHLRDWMDRLPLDRANVIGHSMGGYVAADLTAEAPERVERLVLVDAVALPLAYNRWRQAVGLVHGLWRLPVDFLPVLLTDAHRAGPTTIVRAAHELLAADIQDKLRGIVAPTLLVWGEHDAIVPVELARRLSRTLPRASLAVLPGAGHNPMWDRPEEFNRVVLDFLAADRSRSSASASAQPAA